MHPEILRIGIFSISAWGLTMAISVVLAIIIAVRRAKRMGLSPNVIYDLAIVVVITSIVGSRFFYVVFHLDEFRGNWISMISPFHGPGGFGIAGLSMMGGVLLAIMGVFIYTVVKKLNFFKVGDVIAPTFLLGEGITRIGCFLNGCCFGRPSHLCGVHFKAGAAGQYLREFISHHPEKAGVGLIPTQIIASALGFALFFLLLLLERKRNFNGYTSCLMLILYVLDRFVVDQFRFYESEQVLARIGLITISVNEIALLFLLALAIAMFVLGKKYHKIDKR